VQAAEARSKKQTVMFSGPRKVGGDLTLLKTMTPAQVWYMNLWSALCATILDRLLGPPRITKASGSWLCLYDVQAVALLACYERSLRSAKSMPTHVSAQGLQSAGAVSNFTSGL